MFSPYNCVGVTDRRAYMLNPNAFYAKLRYRQQSYEVCTFGEKKEHFCTKHGSSHYSFLPTHIRDKTYSYYEVVDFVYRIK